MFHLLIVSRFHNLNRMVRTKQTPRNPNKDRPIATVGRDIQSTERRLSPKSIPNKALVKGGKPPRKHLSKKLLCLGATPTGGIKKPHRYRPGLALREIRQYQKSTECLIKNFPFQKLIQEKSQEYQICPQNSLNAGEIPLQEAAANFIVGLFKDVNLLAVHGQKSYGNAKRY